MIDKRSPLELFHVEEWVWDFESDRPMFKEGSNELGALDQVV